MQPSIHLQVMRNVTKVDRLQVICSQWRDTAAAIFGE